MKPRLLVVELHHLGDAVLSLPFVRGAQKEYDVHVLCRPASRAVYELLPSPPTFHVWEPPWADEQPCPPWAAVKGAAAQGRALRPLGFVCAVCAWADARAQILMAGTGAVRRIGFPMTRDNYYAADLPWRRERRILGRLLEFSAWILHPRRPLLTQRLHRSRPDQPHLECWNQLAAAAGFACDYSAPWIKAEPPVGAARRNKMLLAVHARARVPSKQWPVERWRELVSLPAVRGRFDLVEIVPAGEDPVLGDGNTAVRTENVRALADALASSDALLCHDSFPAHLAAALGKPVVAVFGSGEPSWFAPWNNRDRVVQRRVCPLHPCIDRCGMDSYLCLDAISTGDVLAQLERLTPAE